MAYQYPCSGLPTTLSFVPSRPTLLQQPSICLLAYKASWRSWRRGPLLSSARFRDLPSAPSPTTSAADSWSSFPATRVTLSGNYSWNDRSEGVLDDRALFCIRSSRERTDTETPLSNLLAVCNVCCAVCNVPVSSLFLRIHTELHRVLQ